MFLCGVIWCLLSLFVEDTSKSSPKQDVAQQAPMLEESSYNVEETLVWRDGICVQHGNALALLVYQPDQFQVIVSVRGKEQDALHLHRLINNTIENLVEGWYTEIPQLYLPCSNCTAVFDTGQERHWFGLFLLFCTGLHSWRFSLDEVVTAITNGEKYLM